MFARLSTECPALVTKVLGSHGHALSGAGGLAEVAGGVGSLTTAASKECDLRNEYKSSTSMYTTNALWYHV